MSVVIGVDPHKASHTAVVLDDQENVLGRLRVHANSKQAEQLLAWAGSWPDHVWAIEGAGGLGYLLAQQLVAAGEQVLDVQPKLAARVRLLGTGQANKNDPNDARSAAVAALHGHEIPLVRLDDQAAVMRVWVRRRRDIARTRNRVANRLHAVLCELVPGGFAGEISALQAIAMLATIQPRGAAGTARHELATDLVEDLRRLDRQQSQVRTRLASIVAASQTSTTDIFGVGPIIAATVIGATRNVDRFPSADRFAAYTGTAPIEASSGPHKIYRLSRRGNRQLNHAIHMAAVTQIRNRHSVGRSYYDRKISEGMSPKMALRALKRRISNALFKAMMNDAKRAPATAANRNPGGQSRNDSVSSAASSHPEHQLFGKATPGSTSSLEPPGNSAAADPVTRNNKRPPTALDTKRSLYV
jgi:transposase